MSQAFRTADNGFYYPDSVFPAVLDPFASLPLSPSERITRINNEYERVVQQCWITYTQNNPHHSQHNAQKLKNLNAGLDLDVDVDVDSLPLPDSKAAKALFKWARDTLDFGEIQPGVDDQLLHTAQTIVISTALAPGVASKKCQGAAIYLLGLWHMFGLFGVREDRQKAMDLFLESAKLGYSRALYRLGNEYEHHRDINVAVAYFEHGVKRGDAACLYRMALAYLKGQLDKDVDIQLGLQYLKKSSLISDPDCPQPAYIYGLVMLGELPSVYKYDNDKHAVDPESAFLAIERSAWLGFPPAMLRMSKAWQGNGKGFDASVSLRYFHLLSRQEQFRRFKDPKNVHSVPIIDAMVAGIPEVEIAKWFLCGSEDCNLAPNEEWAFKFSALAAEQNNPTGQFAVGYCHEVGIYVPADLAEAKKWYHKAAEAGSHDAVDRLNALALASSNNNNTGNDANTKFTSVSRQLTRKDHERSLTLRGKGSIKSTRGRSAVGNSSEIAVLAPTLNNAYMSSPETSPTRSPERSKDTTPTTSKASPRSSMLYQNGSVPDLSPKIVSKNPHHQGTTAPLSVSPTMPSPVNRGRPETRGGHRATHSVTLQDAQPSSSNRGIRQVSTPMLTVATRPTVPEPKPINESDDEGVTSFAASPSPSPSPTRTSRGSSRGSPSRGLGQRVDAAVPGTQSSQLQMSPNGSIGGSPGTSPQVSPRLRPNSSSSVPSSTRFGDSTAPLIVKKNSQMSLASTGSGTSSTINSPETSPKRSGLRRTSASDLAKQVISVFNKNHRKHNNQKTDDSESLHSLKSQGSRVSLTPSNASADSESSGVSALSLSSTNSVASGNTIGSTNIGGPRPSSPLKTELSTIPEPLELLEGDSSRSPATIRSVSAMSPASSAASGTAKFGHKFNKASSTSLSNMDLPAPASNHSIKSTDNAGSPRSDSLFSRRSTLSSASTAAQSASNPEALTDPGVKRNTYALTFEEMNIPLTAEDKEDCVVM